MISRRGLSVSLGAALLACAVPAALAKEAHDGLYFNRGYDKTIDMRQVLPKAIEAAGRRHILLLVGGDWCGWCKLLELFLAQQADVRSAFRSAFLIVHVPDHIPFLDRYPDLEGYPAFIILRGDGAFAGVQDTSVLEQGYSYNPAKMIAFAQFWSSAP